MMLKAADATDMPPCHISWNPNRGGRYLWQRVYERGMVAQLTNSSYAHSTALDAVAAQCTCYLPWSGGTHTVATSRRSHMTYTGSRATIWVCTHARHRQQ